MSREGKVGCLGALALYWLAGMAVMSLAGEALDQSPALGAIVRILFFPVFMTSPFGLPALMAALFAVLGRSASRAKRAARIGSALALYLVILIPLMTYAFAGRFEIGATDGITMACALAIAVGLGAWGFSRDRAIPSGGAVEP